MVWTQIASFFSCYLFINVFPDCKVLLCDFHREKAWNEWTHKKENGWQEKDLTLLQDVAHSYTEEEYKENLFKLQNSAAWRGNERLRSWFSYTWIPQAKVSFLTHIKLAQESAVKQNIFTQDCNTGANKSLIIWSNVIVMFVLSKLEVGPCLADWCGHPYQQWNRTAEWNLQGPSGWLQELQPGGDADCHRHRIYPIIIPEVS